MAARYNMKQDLEGCTVYDIFTGLPVLVRNVPQTGLDIEAADDLADLLTFIERKHEDTHRELTR